jgi:uncharacterized short protein YbdD (DUF466 family)
MRRATELLARVAHVVRRVIGVPDYERYVAHVARCHPGTAPLDRDAFMNDVLARRYERPGSRCC